MLTQINCPNCQSPIPIDLKGLVGGESFHCKCCQAKLSLSEDSTDVVSSAVTSFEKVAQQAKG